MKTTVTASLLLLGFMAGVPATLPAKGPTTKIVIKGGDLRAPIEITDAKGEGSSHRTSTLRDRFLYKAQRRRAGLCRLLPV